MLLTVETSNNLDISRTVTYTCSDGILSDSFVFTLEIATTLNTAPTLDSSVSDITLTVGEIYSDTLPSCTDLEGTQSRIFFLHFIFGKNSMTQIFSMNYFPDDNSQAGTYILEYICTDEYLLEDILTFVVTIYP